ncbi:vacuolar ATP synthase subunit D [Spathaspora passalidarum NRRL Y-27907]|uniref:V-type proton ATPase subunit n=1 Tax=Spathaspora passalidarum (strain NRRL Y-27907 / 11-Y1) TaxID=619300 RepID=G3ASJ7_SPAPN|nr:vacuolar ATP synthase subunit D [Spathaspora passalidarum NRRL Y-27907]EGW30683.1 vacuolar ATP synthase subunit D [Spathaspora passalidarum NRRL Y-27907]
MEGLYFNINNGYLEGVVRGYKSGLLTTNQYVNLTQCDNLEDLKLQLSSTDYGNFMANYSGPLSTSVLQDNLSKKLFQQFQYVKSQSSGKLTKFMNYINYGYMIDNVILMITGTLHERDKSEILRKCNPLGWFDTLPTLSIATDIESLYSTVLIDTPLAPFFKNCVSADDLDDLNIEIIRNKLYKNYLESFVEFVTSEFDGPDQEIMIRLLTLEADKRVINITLNSLNNSDLSSEDKLSLFPSYGKLYPTYHLQLSQAEDIEQLKSIVEYIGDYKDIFNESGDASGLRGLGDWFYLLEMQFCRNAFTQQFTLSTVYAWLKSKEQEIRNITWIAECIAQNQKNRIDSYISVY